MKRAIFWDSDGTLLYGNESFRISLMRALGEYGYSLDEDIARTFMKSVCSWYMPEKNHSDKNGGKRYLKKFVCFVMTEEWQRYSNNYVRDKKEKTWNFRCFLFFI